MNDWDTVEMAAKRRGWKRWRWTGSSSWKCESEWSSVDEMLAAGPDTWWCGPCPFTGNGGDHPRNSCRTRYQDGADDRVEIHCQPCQDEAGVTRLHDVPGRNYWDHKARLLAFQ